MYYEIKVKLTGNLNIKLEISKNFDKFQYFGGEF